MDYINRFSEALLTEFYLKEGETIQDAYHRACHNYLPDHKQDLGDRIQSYLEKAWAMLASPVLSNAPVDRNKPNRAMPISCFLMDIPDTIDGQIDANSEMAALSVSGGGIGMNNEIRGVSEKAPGAIPYIKTIDSSIAYYRQSRSRKGACAVYMDVSHPDIIEFINIRRNTTGDSARKVENKKQVHNAVIFDKRFVRAVDTDDSWDLIDPATNEVRETIKARQLWEAILDVREMTGEPYLFNKDNVNSARIISSTNKDLEIKASNLCSEITIATNSERTGVCCLSSLNLEYFDEWKDTPIVGDFIEFLDYVLEYFIQNAEPHLKKAVYSATMGRDLGLGTMGFHYYLQKNGIPFESGGFGSAAQANHKIFAHIHKHALEATLALGAELGECPDMKGTGRRNTTTTSIAPNANSSVILDTSASIDPVSSNSYAYSTRVGTYQVRNKYLDKLLHKKAADAHLKNPDKWVAQQWAIVEAANGSAQGLTCLTPDEKATFKTAFEIDQHWVIHHAEYRALYIEQSQSVNLYFPSGTDKGYFNSVHLKALRSSTLKTLYYCRMQREGKVESLDKIQRQALKDWHGDNTEAECVSCQG